MRHDPIDPGQDVRRQRTLVASSARSAPLHDEQTLSVRRAWVVWWVTLVLALYPGAAPAQGISAPATFARAAEAVRPAVINIVVPRTTGDARELYWGEPVEEDISGGPWSSVGAGVIVAASGVAITSARVVQDSAGIEAVMTDGSRHAVTVVGLDARTDVAVVRLGGTGPFPFARFGDSARLEVGDWVIAVGSPYGLQATVTAGILSAKARHLGVSDVEELLQTDAAVNLGNSGGPIVNLAGEIIGISTMVVEGGCGIAFAVPSNVAKRIATELLERGRVRWSWLGVSGQPLTPELARALGVTPMRGLLVTDVVRSSPGANAGLRPGDILLELNGQALAGPEDLRRVLARFAPGSMALLKAWREGRERIVSATLGEEPEARRAAHFPGFAVRPLTPEMGVVVTGVPRLGPAWLAGLRRGDILREINSRPIRSIEDFEAITERVKEGDRIVLLVQRADVALYVAFVAPTERSGRPAHE